MSLQLKDAAVRLEQELSSRGLQCADPKLHAKQILQAVLGISSSGLYIHWDRPLTAVESEKFWRLLSRRSSGEPFQYLVGYEWFWKFPFEVGPGVLIPRRETELLVEKVLEIPGKALRVAELGAGSGNIGISVLREKESWLWDGYEMNPETLPYLRTNVVGLLGSQTRYRIIPGDFTQLALGHGPYDIAVSNPPYVVTETIDQLSLEVKHEPRLALDGGKDGLDAVRRFFETSHSILKEESWAFCEIGAGQAGEISEWLTLQNWREIQVWKDLSGVDRVVAARKGAK